MKPENKTAPVFLSSEIYSAEAVKLAAAVFAGRAEVRILKASGGVKVEIPGGENAAGEFCNEALNQQCRIDLGLKNSKIASLIATKALLSAAGVEQSGAASEKKAARR
jgi:hypothetical protein